MIFITRPFSLRNQILWNKHIEKHWFKAISADSVGQLAENRLQDVSVALTRMETRRYIFTESSQEKKPEINFLKFTILPQRDVDTWNRLCVSQVVGPRALPFKWKTFVMCSSNKGSAIRLTSYPASLIEVIICSEMAVLWAPALHPNQAAFHRCCADIII